MQFRPPMNLEDMLLLDSSLNSRRLSGDEMTRPSDTDSRIYEAFVPRTALVAGRRSLGALVPGASRSPVSMCRNRRPLASSVLTEPHVCSCVFSGALVGDGERAAGGAVRLCDRRLVRRKRERVARGAARNGAHVPRPARAAQNGR